MRIALKTLSYSVMHMVVAFGVAYAISGRVDVAVGISLVEPLVQTLFYAAHEHLWTSQKQTNSLREVGHA